MPALFALALGWALVYLAGGDPRLPALPRIRAAWILIALFLLQGIARGRLLASLDLGALGIWIWAFVVLLLVLMCWRLAALPGVGLVGAGMAGNALVVLANGGMPVLAPAGTAMPTSFYHAVVAHDRFVWLGDILSGPAGFRVSAGDLLIALGLIVIILYGGLSTPLADPSLSSASVQR